MKAALQEISEKQIKKIVTDIFDLVKDSIDIEKGSLSSVIKKHLDAFDNLKKEDKDDDAKALVTYSKKIDIGDFYILAGVISKVTQINPPINVIELLKSDNLYGIITMTNQVIRNLPTFYANQHDGEKLNFNDTTEEVFKKIILSFSVANMLHSTRLPLTKLLTGNDDDKRLCESIVNETGKLLVRSKTSLLVGPETETKLNHTKANSREIYGQEICKKEKGDDLDIEKAGDKYPKDTTLVRIEYTPIVDKKVTKGDFFNKASSALSVNLRGKQELMTGFAEHFKLTFAAQMDKVLKTNVSSKEKPDVSTSSVSSSSKKKEEKKPDDFKKGKPKKKENHAELATSSNARQQ
jgi:hypothetical protein